LASGYKPARHVETGKIDPGRRALVGLGSRGCGDKRILSRDEIFGLIFAPIDDVENRPHRGRCALGSDFGR